MIESGLSFNDFETMSDEELTKYFGRKRQRDDSYSLPDYVSLSKELSKPGVTMQLLWEEYVEISKISQKKYYGITQFKRYFSEHIEQNSFTDIIKHKAGMRIEVDWAGKRPQWIDPDTGEVIYGRLFVGVLPFSKYGFAWVTPDMTQTSWINAHIKMFEYFGGVSTYLVCDNLKTGVTKNSKYQIELNQTYSDMANYYKTIVLPTRVRAPKDKSSSEGHVNIFTTNIIARMRNYQFFTIEEYNAQLIVELEKINTKPFQKMEGSRQERFETIEKSCLQPLPAVAYELAEWRIAKVLNGILIHQ